MAVQAAVPSHGGEVLAVFVKDANEKLCAPASNFLGMNCAGAGSMELGFEKVDGTLGETLVTLTVTDADGVGFKKEQLKQLQTLLPEDTWQENT